MSHYIPKNKKDEKDILDILEIDSFEDLVSIIPPKLRVKDGILGLDSGISEYELTSYIESISKKENVLRISIFPISWMSEFKLSLIKLINFKGFNLCFVPMLIWNLVKLFFELLSLPRLFLSVLDLEDFLAEKTLTSLAFL